MKLKRNEKNWLRDARLTQSQNTIRLLQASRSNLQYDAVMQKFFHKS